jgi:hypothetical protein
MLKSWLAGFGVLAGAYSVSAQDIPTDTELFAAYCLGALTQVSATQQQLLDKPCPSGHEVACNRGKSALSQSNAEVNERLIRTKRYLETRLFGQRSSATSTGMLVAQQTGETDAKRCSDWTNANFEKVIDSAMKCRYAEGSSEQKTCLEAGQPDFCKQSKRCNDLSRLPL